ncbi:hypothetical protein SDJN03_03244, partial [Cucurbita argyrosperma subsp. sororia]
MAGALKSFSPIAMINADTELLVQLPQNDCNPTVLVLGGTGRVGTSIAIALFKFSSLAVATGAACCETEKNAAMVATVGRNSRFVEVDAENVKSLEAALRGVDPVVHIAGSFQQTEKCTSFLFHRASNGGRASTCWRDESRGNGGAGPSLLATSFLLLGEKVVAYNKGDEKESRVVYVRM